MDIKVEIDGRPHSNISDRWPVISFENSSDLRKASNSGYLRKVISFENIIYLRKATLEQ